MPAAQAVSAEPVTDHAQLTPAASGAQPNGFTRQQIANAISPRYQKVTLFPTEKCNFRCTYCYEDFALGKMSRQLQSAIEKFLERRIPTLEALYLSWFGGEPLLAKDVVLRIAAFAHRLCQQHGTGFGGGLTTNGYVLTLELADRLIALKQNYFQITLDGWGAVHDETRRRADGRGTFHTIWSNLNALKSSSLDFHAHLRVHARPGNLDNLELLMRKLAEAFGRDSRYELEFQNIRDLGGAGGKTLGATLTFDEMREKEKTLREIRQGAQPGDSAVPGAAAEVQALPYICYASKPNNLIIRSNGRIGKCTVAPRPIRGT